MVKYIKKTFIILLILISTFFILSAVSATGPHGEIEDTSTVKNLSNHNMDELRYDNNGSYLFFPPNTKGNGSGIDKNVLQISDNNGSNHTGTVIQGGLKGTFFIGYNGSGAWMDNIILMIAVNGTLDENFYINIVASGYQWNSVLAQEYPHPDELMYVIGLNDTFNSSDFFYISTFKPSYLENNPIFPGQNLGDTGNTFSIMFIDLNVGDLGQYYIDVFGPNIFINNGKVKLEYFISGLPADSLLVFNVYGYKDQDQNGAGVQWTNNVNYNFLEYDENESSQNSTLLIVNNSKQDSFINSDDYFIEFIAAGQGNGFNVRLTDINGNPIAGRSISVVTYMPNGDIQERTKVTDLNGMITIGRGYAPGNYTMFYYFLGDDQYNPSNGTIDVKIFLQFLNTTVNHVSNVVREGEFFEVILRDSSNALLQNELVVFTVGGVDYFVMTDLFGVARLEINLDPGKYNMTYCFFGRNQYRGCQNFTVLTVNGPKQDSFINSDDYFIEFIAAGQANGFNVRLTDINGNPIAGRSVSVVTYMPNGDIQERTKVTDLNGMITIGRGYAPGNYSMFYYFLGDDQYNPSNGTIDVKIFLQFLNTTVNHVSNGIREDEYFEVKLKDSNNEPLQNEQVIFSINGVDYFVWTDLFGVARLEINLNPGRYTITYSFLGSGEYHASQNLTNLIVREINYDAEISHESGFYNSSNLTVSIVAYDNQSLIFFSMDNGTNWHNGTGNIIIVFDQGIWNLQYYIKKGNYTGLIYNFTYILDNIPPVVWSNYDSGVYNKTIIVNLTVLDSMDENPIIYYTLDGSIPTIHSLIYNSSLIISNSTTLIFFSIDKYGNKGTLITVHYIFSPVVNLNTGKGYDNIQSAIDDNETLANHIIEIAPGNYYENIIINKPIVLRGSKYGEVNIRNANNNSRAIIQITPYANGTIITGLNILDAEYNVGIDLYGTSNCVIINNTFKNNWHSIVSRETHYGICPASCYDSNAASKNNWILNNIIYTSWDGGGITLHNIENYLISDNIIVSYTAVNGIDLFHTKNTLIQNNLIIGGGLGIVTFQGLNNTIKNNTVTGVNWGIDLRYTEYTLVYENTIINNGAGIVFLFSDATNKVYLNRIQNNSNFGIYAHQSNVTAINNWWGSMNPSISTNYNESADIFLDSGSQIDFDPYIVIYLDYSSNKVEDNVYEVTIIADLKHNSEGEDISSLGCVPDGIPICFSKIKLIFESGEIEETIMSICYTKNGELSFEILLIDFPQMRAIVDFVIVHNGVTYASIILREINCGTWLTHEAGFYNESNLTASIIAYDNQSLIFFTVNNGTNWYNATGNVTINFGQGIWDLQYYIKNGDYVGAIYNVTYIIDNIPPLVQTNYDSGVYKETILLKLTALDNVDDNPTIYYTLDGSIPTTDSLVYYSSIIISNSTTLRFFAVDKFGNKGEVKTKHYIYSKVGNLDTGIGYNTIQEAIDDPLTLDGHIIEVSSGNYTENIILNKSLVLLAVQNATVNLMQNNKYLPIIKITSDANGTIIIGFSFIGSNNYAIDLSGASDCLIMGNIFLENHWSIISSSDVTSKNNWIINNTFINQKLEYWEEIGILLRNTEDCIITNNILSINYGDYGINIISSKNILIHNNYVNMSFEGIKISEGSNISIMNNTLTNNINNGITLWNTVNITVYENTIIKNGVGIFAYHTNTTNISFNRITENSNFGLDASFSTVNAINNWWGTNDIIISTNFNNKGADIYIWGSSVNYNPYIVVSIHPTSYKVENGEIYEVTVVADLNHNSNGEDISSLGSVPDGIPVYFAEGENGENLTLLSVSYTKNGEVSAKIFLNNTFNSTTIFATIDKGMSYTSIVNNTAVAQIIVTSSAIDINTGLPLYFTYDLPLNESVSWISLLWTQQGSFTSNVSLIINGKIVNSILVLNSGYLKYKTQFSNIFFEAIQEYNYMLFVKYSLETQIELYYPVLKDYYSFNESYLSGIKEKYNLTDYEMNFIKENYAEFYDDISIAIYYPGDKAKTVNVNNETITFKGNEIIRADKITYINGAYIDTEFDNETNNLYFNFIEAYYDGVISFAFATTKITDDILEYWLNQKDATDSNGTLLYPEGGLKAAYGTFLAALLAIAAHDKVADIFAAEYNVTWSRTTPIAICVADAHDVYAFISGEMDHRMGMKVEGSPENVFAFLFVCSSSFQLVENWVMESLGFIKHNEKVALLSILESFNNGEAIELIFEGNYILIRDTNNPDKVLVFDLETGLLRDLVSFNNVSFSGSHCYSKPQTEYAYNAGQMLLGIFSVESLTVFGLRSLAITSISSILTGVLAIPLTIELGRYIWADIYGSMGYLDLADFYRNNNFLDIVKDSFTPNLTNLYLLSGWISNSFSQVKDQVIEDWEMIKTIILLLDEKQAVDSLKEIQNNLKNGPAAGGAGGGDPIKLGELINKLCNSIVENVKSGNIVQTISDLGTLAIAGYITGVTLYNSNNQTIFNIRNNNASKDKDNPLDTSINTTPKPYSNTGNISTVLDFLRTNYYYII